MDSIGMHLSFSFQFSGGSGAVDLACAFAFHIERLKFGHLRNLWSMYVKYL